MKDKVTVSVIVPMYNAEKTIQKCMNSLLNQNYPDIEIIAVDDGSTDSTADIVAAMDVKIKLIKKENGGVSSARNCGIENASGTYIAFCDSDDTYEPNAIKQLVEQGNQADLVIGSVKKIFSDRVEIEAVDSFYGNTKKQVAQCIVTITENFMLNQMWGKLFKAEIIHKNDIFLDETMDCGEDLDFVCRFCKNISDIALVSDIVYNYDMTQNNASLSQKFRMNLVELCEKNNKELTELYHCWEMYDDCENILAQRHLYNMWVAMNMINNPDCTLSVKQKTEYIRDIKNLDTYQIYMQKYGEKVISKLNYKIMSLKSERLIVFVLSLRKLMKK